MRMSQGWGYQRLAEKDRTGKTRHAKSRVIEEKTRGWGNREGSSAENEVAAQIAESQ